MMAFLDKITGTAQRPPAAHEKEKELQFLSDSSSISFTLSHAGFAPPFHEEFFSTVGSDEAWVAFPLHFISDPNEQGNFEAPKGTSGSDEAWVAFPLHFISDPDKQGNLEALEGLLDSLHLFMKSFFSTFESDEAWVAFPLHFISDPDKQGNFEALERLLVRRNEK
ncbi:hypothetical protein CDAR_600291 [Caerostris darwini]|uniref:Uncharacterized protein n=1 Tax=Caerostris darwini TaxID=1538125 RepID=A0AAV4STT3_9ARAC|nr:hypothetical protein CDAR_600291 [Caerostris darwini]